MPAEPVFDLRGFPGLCSGMSWWCQVDGFSPSVYGAAVFHTVRGDDGAAFRADAGDPGRINPRRIAL